MSDPHLTECVAALRASYDRMREDARNKKGEVERALAELKEAINELDSLNTNNPQPTEDDGA